MALEKVSNYAYFMHLFWAPSCFLHLKHILHKYEGLILGGEEAIVNLKDKRAALSIIALLNSKHCLWQ